jgi:histidinol-phosphate/aromatic aminotransferase/cobyric acid decarboxylase-like protein
VIPPAGAHGGDGAALAAALGLDPADVLDLSASLNPVAPDPAPLVAQHAGAARRYPDPGAARVALAATLGVDPDRLVLTNGGAEAIALVAAETGPGWVEEPEFSLYRRHLPEVRRGAPRWRSDPHNPSGRLAGPGEAAAVWDEAFYPLATGRWTSGRADGGATVIGSLTKVFACPGLRLGFVLAPDPSLAARLAARQPQWAVNGVAAGALPAFLATADLPAWRDAIARLRDALGAVLATHGLAALPSEANYVLVPGAGGLREALAPRGVVVRDCASFGLPGHVRIAVPDEDGIERLDRALAGAAASGRWPHGAGHALPGPPVVNP